MNGHPVAMVTGAAGGIGRAICAELAARGFSLIACDRASDELATVVRELARNGSAQARVFDLADEDACREAVGSIERLDVLVNNAGAWFFEPLLESTDAHWREVMEINVIAPVRLSRLAADLLASSGRARVVNIASRNAFFGEGGWSSYDVSKAALVALTRALALELAAKGILVNAIAPGFIATDSNQAVLDDAEASERYRSRIPLGTFGTPADVAKVVAFLCTEDCDWATGSTFVLDGGQLAGEL